MGHDDGRICDCVRDHVPNPHELHRHHVWPLALGGPDAEWNLVWLCPTAHVNTHELLREWFRLGGEPPWTVRQSFGVHVRALAKRGYLWTVYPAERPSP